MTDPNTTDTSPSVVTIGDTFAIRNGERVRLRLRGTEPEDTMAFMCASVPALPTPSCERSASGKTVESYCVVGAELVNGKWQWMQLAPDTKEHIGNLLFDFGLERNVWHGALIEAKQVGGQP